MRPRVDPDEVLAPVPVWAVPGTTLEFIPELGEPFGDDSIAAMAR